jgi:hypothetical protein
VVDKLIFLEWVLWFHLLCAMMLQFIWSQRTLFSIWMMAVSTKFWANICGY